jgi:hypothetical protein
MAYSIHSRANLKFEAIYTGKEVLTGNKLIAREIP